ncbi:hypothetical protein BVRB_042040, partial [Beta vulgaris subsp. vulgaris]
VEQHHNRHKQESGDREYSFHSRSDAAVRRCRRTRPSWDQRLRVGCDSAVNAVPHLNQLVEGGANPVVADLETHLQLVDFGLDLVDGQLADEGRQGVQLGRCNGVGGANHELSDRMAQNIIARLSQLLSCRLHRQEFLFMAGDEIGSDNTVDLLATDCWTAGDRVEVG